MKEVHIFDSRQYLKLKDGQIAVYKQRKLQRMIALNELQALNVFGNCQISTQLIKRLGLKGIDLHYYNQNGQYLMSLKTEANSDYDKQIDQFLALSQKKYRLKMARKILRAKIFNQIELIKAYNAYELVTDEEIKQLSSYLSKIEESQNLSQMLGYEGRAAKSYFYYLGLLVPSNFRFNRRSKRPPRDPFNSLLSLGYSILHGYCRGALVKYGLNLGIGIIHQNKRHHETLASDLMEEWRAIIVDDVVMRLISRQELTPDMFKEEAGRVVIDQSGKKIFLNELRSRMFESHYYFDWEKRVGFIHALNLQVESLMRSFDAIDADLYLNTSIGDL